MRRRRGCVRGRCGRHGPSDAGLGRRRAAGGAGAVTAVEVNGKPWRRFDAQSVTLPFREVSDVARVAIGLGGAAPPEIEIPVPREPEVNAAALPGELDWKAGGRGASSPRWRGP